jgi:hypothetical protein
MKTPPKMIRVTVPVTPAVLAKFQRFSEASGLSVGKSMGDWLRDTMQGLDAMIDILETHKRAPADAMAKLASLASSVQVISDGAIEKMKAAPSPLGEGAPPAGKSLAVAKGAMLRAIAEHPPSCNTGGKLPTQAKPKKVIFPPKGAK